MCDDYTNHLLECILDRLESDEYEDGDVYTVGGPTGLYIVRSPYNTECEWTLLSAFQGVVQSNLVGSAVAAVLTNASTAGAGFTSADLSVGQYSVLDIDIIFTSFTGGTTPNIQYFVKRKDSAGNYDIIWQPAAVTVATTYTLSIGQGVANGSNAFANDQSVGIDFGDIVQVGYVTTGAPTSVTQQINIKGKGAVVPVVANGSIAISSANPAVQQFSINPTLGAAAAGQEGNAFQGLFFPMSSAVSYASMEHWQPLGHGANLYIGINATTTNVYALIAMRRKLDRYIPQMPRMYPSTHSQPQSRRALRQLPAQSAQVAGFESQYPHLERKRSSFEHQQGDPKEDTRNIGNAIKRITRHGL